MNQPIALPPIPKINDYDNKLQWEYAMEVWERTIE